MISISTIKHDIIGYLKINKPIIIIPLVSIVGYVIFIVSLVLRSTQGTVSDYLPVLPMISGIALNLIPVMYFFDLLKTYAQTKNQKIHYVMNEPPKDKKKKKLTNQTEEETNNDIKIFSPKTNSFFLPVMSLVYRVFCYTGIFLLVSILILRYLGFRFTPSELIRFFFTGIFFSLLYESFRIISYVIVSLFDLLLHRKMLLIISNILSFSLFLFILINFILGFIGSDKVSGGFLSGLSSIAVHSFWDYIPLSSFTFDVFYTAIGYDMGNTYLHIGILFIVSEVVLYILLGLKKFLKPFGFDF